MNEVTVYATPQCPYCVRAEQLLKASGCDRIRKILVHQDPSQLATMMARSGRRTVPQIFVGDRHIGGYDDLARLPRDELDALLGLPAPR